MTVDEARKITKGLRGWGWNYEPGDGSMIVDGHFTADQLEALAIVLRDDRKRDDPKRLCEHVPPGYACELCNHDGVPDSAEGAKNER